MIEYRYIGLFFVLALRASCDMPHPLRITCHHDLDSCEIPLLAFVSCRNASSERAKAIVSGNSEETAMGECDPLVWAAIQEAVENINHNGSGIWRNGRWESIGLKIHLMDIVTQVRNTWCEYTCYQLTFVAKRTQFPILNLDDFRSYCAT